MWKAIVYAKSLGCLWFEVGERLINSNSLENEYSNKEFGISDFKAGFGGQTSLYLDLKLNMDNDEQ